MKNRFSTVVAVAATLVLAHHALAQAAPPVPGGNQRGLPQPPRIEQLDFEGGNVVEYVALIRRLNPEANFALMPGAEEFRMPAMQLRNVRLEQAAVLIGEISTRPPHGEIHVRPIGDVYAVQVELRPQAAQPQRRPAEPLVISLADIIGDEIRAEDVLTSIEISLDLFGEDFPQAAVRFHEGTRLLIARGHREQMNQIANVVEQLRAGRPRPSPETAALRQELQQRSFLIERLQRRISELEDTIDGLRRER